MEVAERDPEVIKQEIAAARDRLASTVDLLAERANPQRVAEDAKAKALGFVNQPKVKAALAGVGALTFLGMLRRFRRR
jgi:hypothetical protein